MAQRMEELGDSLNRLQDQVKLNKEEGNHAANQLSRVIDLYKRENDKLSRDNEYLKTDVEQLKRENIQLKGANDQLKQDINQVKHDQGLLKGDNDRRFGSLNDEVHNLKSRILDYFFQQSTTSANVSKKFRSEESEEIVQFPVDCSLVEADVDAEVDTDHDMSTFASMPDDAIRLILTRLPLRHRVVLRIICHRWKSIIELMCRSVRSLKLFGPTFRNLNYNKETDISRHNLLLIDMKRKAEAPKYPKGIAQIQFIPQLFCNVDQVELSFPETFEMTVMQLFEPWADRLTSLTLDIRVKDQFLAAAIWQRITQMPKLESYSLINFKFLYLFNAQNNQLAFLGQLRELKIDQFVNNGSEIIRFVGSNIRRLEMYCGGYSPDIFSGIQNRPAVFANLTHLTLIFDQLHVVREHQPRMLQFICRHFVSLIELKLDYIRQVPFDEQLTQLSQLLHLTRVHLYMTQENLDRDLPRAIQFALLQSLVLHIWMKPMTPKQTKLRPINITQRSRIMNFLNEIPNMFPVLVELKIVARLDLTVQFIEELVNDSVLKSTDRIKYELIGKRVVN